ncbi:cell filamentation protein Fic, partial [Turicibacter sanguinis]|nr:cell filamentation protein Fic [Turicibacter sanguinis]
YAAVRLGEQWCLTADQSLDLYSGKTTVPVQVIIKSPKGHNNTQKLMYDTSLLVFQSEIPDQVYKEPEYGLNLYPLAEALVYATPRYFQVERIAACTCLAMIRDAADILKVLARNGASLRAGRIAGAFRNIGNSEIADSIVSTMRGFGYDVREEDPFEDQPRTPLVYEVSPYVTRLRLMWENMRDKVVELFPEAPGKIDDVEGYLRSVDEKYSEDAYHSLSIEGYRVSPELIEKVRVGNWKPEEEDKEHKNALVARGYYQAFQAVRGTISDILKGKNAGEAVRADHPLWYMQMWMPFVTVGILQREDLVGYRTGQVYIRGSQHIPLNPKAVRDA